MNCLKSVPWFNQGTLFFIRLKISKFFFNGTDMERCGRAK